VSDSLFELQIPDKARITDIAENMTDYEERSLDDVLPIGRRRVVLLSTLTVLALGGALVCIARKFFA
jgi:hypothetical protein